MATETEIKRIAEILAGWREIYDCAWEEYRKRNYTEAKRFFKAVIKYGDDNKVKYAVPLGQAGVRMVAEKIERSEGD